MIKNLRTLAEKANFKLIISIIILSLVFLALVTVALTSPVNRWGDGSTYYMQVLSIVYDHDIQYTQADAQYIIMHPLGDVPAGMFLIKTIDGRYFYGKDYSFSLFASFFYVLIGNNGILLFNAILFFCMILMGYFYLRKYNGILSVIYSLLFFGLSALFVYMLWMNPDLYDAFLIMLGLFIWLIYIEKSDVRYLAIASFVLGLVAVSKAPDAVVFIPVFLYELYKRHYMNLLIALGPFLLAAGIFLGYFYLQSGTLSFYGGDRLYYLGNYPFWGPYDSTHEAGIQAFSINAGNTLSALFDLNDLKIIPYNFFYYFFGRFTGMLWYYPFAVFALVSFAFQGRRIRYFKEHPEKLCILGAIVLYIFTYVVLIGDNYFGGQWAVGNRYFYIYPAFLFLFDKVDWKKGIIFLAIAMITVLPLVSAPIATSNDPGGHTYQFPYTYFPLDMSQLGNLPMTGQTFTNISGNNFTIYGGTPRSYNGTLFVMSGDMLILSGSPIENLNMSLMAYFDYNNGSISTKGFSEEVPLANKDIVTVTLTGMEPIYSDSRQYIYEVNVELT